MASSSSSSRGKKNGSSKPTENGQLTVYRCFFASPGKYDHQGILVSNDLKKTGTLFHVKSNETKEDRKAKIMRYTFEELKNYDVNQSVGFNSAENVGTIAKIDLQRLRDLCIRTGEVVRPSFTGRTPNCNSWVNNVLHDANEERIISFQSALLLKKLQLRFDGPSSK